MDQKKIGKFIAECRKKQNLTQMQLAELLGITDRAVSKWETGKALPDASLMLPLCEILKITVNDLLCGEVRCMEHYNRELEERVIMLVREQEEATKKLLRMEWVIAILSLVVLFVPIIIAITLPMEEWQSTALAFSGFLPAIVGFFFALKIEQVAGFYECPRCQEKHIPTYGAVVFAPHLGRTRYMKCPHCEKRSWQKKVIGEDNHQ